ncbi:MAG: DUF3467 domain-containing protein [Candidatus Gracilibacteria bacterium]
MADNKPTDITINIPPHKLAGAYTNLVSITIGKNEVIVDFAFMLPAQNPPTGELVERIIMTPEVARSFLSAFQNAVLDFEKQKQE